MAAVGNLTSAVSLFNEMKEKSCPDIKCWNALLFAYIKADQTQNAVALFEELLQQGPSPTDVSFVGVLLACKQNPTQAKHYFKLLSNYGISPSLQHYSCVLKAILPQEALTFFSQIPSHFKQHTELWNIIFSELTGNLQQGLKLFQDMQCSGVFPDAETYTYLVQACEHEHNIKVGNELYAHAINSNVPFSPGFCMALLNLYLSSGKMPLEVDTMLNYIVKQSPNVITWTAIITALTKHKKPKHALEAFYTMQYANISPNEISYLCALSACADLAATPKGVELHSSLLNSNTTLSPLMVTALLHMYSKCGDLLSAVDLFSSLSPSEKDLIAWYERIVY